MGALTYNIDTFSEKLHEMSKFWAVGGAPLERPLTLVQGTATSGNKSCRRTQAELRNQSEPFA